MINHVNKVPVANAGPAQTVNEGSLVTLDGSGSSDGDSDELTYEWIAPAVITLSSSIAFKPTFTAPEVDENTSYTFRLLVNDGEINSSESIITILVSQGNKHGILKVATAEGNLITV